MSIEAVTLGPLARDIHTVALEHGWWKTETSKNVGMALALIHSEVSEALECYREGHSMFETWTDDKGAPQGVPFELADVIIRVLDVCAAFGVDIDGAMVQKLAYNRTRPFRHGGKLA